MSSTEKGSIWGDIWGGVTEFVKDDGKDLVMDYARAKWIDVETTNSDRNMPDEIDLRAGFAPQAANSGTSGAAPAVFAGMTQKNLLVIGGFGLIALVVAKKVL